VNSKTAKQQNGIEAIVRNICFIGDLTEQQKKVFRNCR